MWDLPRPGLKLVSPALAGRFSTPAPSGKPCFFFFKDQDPLLQRKSETLNTINFIHVLCSAGPTSKIHSDSRHLPQPQAQLPRRQPRICPVHPAQGSASSSEKDQTAETLSDYSALTQPCRACAQAARAAEGSGSDWAPPKRLRPGTTARRPHPAAPQLGSLPPALLRCK